MDFDKLKEACTKIKMPSDMKKRIAVNCNAAEVPEAPEKPQRRLDGRLIAACACCFFLLLGIGLTYSGIFEKKPPIAPEVTDFSDTSEESRLLEILSTAKSTAAQIFETTKGNISEPETEVKTQLQSQQEVESTVSESTAEFTTAPFIFPNNEYVADTGSDDDVQGVPPPMLEIERDVFQKLKRASETMSDEEFERYLEQDKFFAVGYGRIHSKQTFLQFWNIVKDLYVPVVDETDGEINSMIYRYWLNEIDCLILMHDYCLMRYFISTTETPSIYFEENLEIRFVKSIRRGALTADVYRYRAMPWKEEDPWSGFRVNVTIEGQKFSFKVGDEQSIEEFEEMFSKVKFMKFKDWIG